MLQSRHDFFNNLKLGIQCPNFSAGNASDEPLSAASFSALGGLVGSPENPLKLTESPETLTPTLPARRASPRDDDPDFFANLDRELLDD